MKKTLLLTLLAIPVILTGCGKDPTPSDQFDKKVQCKDMGKAYVEEYTEDPLSFYGYVEELDSCVVAYTVSSTYNLSYIIQDILNNKSIYTCDYIFSLDWPGGNKCNSEFFKKVDEYSLR